MVVYFGDGDVTGGSLEYGGGGGGLARGGDLGEAVSYSNSIRI